MYSLISTWTVELFTTVTSRSSAETTNKQKQTFQKSWNHKKNICDGFKRITRFSGFPSEPKYWCNNFLEAEITTSQIPVVTSDVIRHISCHRNRSTCVLVSGCGSRHWVGQTTLTMTSALRHCALFWLSGARSGQTRVVISLNWETWATRCDIVISAEAFPDNRSLFPLVFAINPATWSPHAACSEWIL